MPRLSQLSEVYKPARSVQLQPDSFNATWPTRPKEEVPVGLRLASSKDKIFVQVEARKRADLLGRDSDENHAAIEQDARVRLLVARCICDPNDASKPHPDLLFAEDMVFDALTDSGARYLFDEILRLQVETAQGASGSIEDVGRLLSLLHDGALETLSDSGYQTVLRHLSFALSIVDDELQ